MPSPIVRTGKVMRARNRRWVVVGVVAVLFLIAVLPSLVQGSGHKADASGTHSPTSASSTATTAATQAPKPSPTTKPTPKKTKAPATQAPKPSPTTKPTPKKTKPTPKKTKAAATQAPKGSGKTDVTKSVTCDSECTVVAVAQADSAITLEFSASEGNIIDYTPDGASDTKAQVTVKFKGTVDFHSTGSNNVTIETTKK